MTHVLMLVTSNLLHDNRVRREAETLAAAGYRQIPTRVCPAGRVDRFRVH